MLASTGKILTAILLLAFMARLGADYFIARQVTKRSDRSVRQVLFTDSLQIYEIAENLASGKGHIDNQGRISWRMPLYQMFIAGLIKIGLNEASHIRLIQSFIGVCNVLLAFLLARKLGGPRAGLLTAAGMAFYPMLVYFNALVLTETFAVTFILLIMYIWDAYLHGGRDRNLIFCGLMLGLLALHKASLGLLILLLIVWTAIVRLWRGLADASASGCHHCRSLPAGVGAVGMAELQ